MSILGAAYKVSKKYTKALDYQQQALAIARGIKNRELESKALPIIKKPLNLWNKAWLLYGKVKIILWNRKL
ncbi:MAG: hypothetical protein PUP92_26540 [Rhizonema sp. PD38]|nr:hypothetical protein [Rhizonema sp. PD38]